MKKNLFLLTILMFCIQLGYAQSRQVGGKVSDASGGGLPGVSVTVKGTSQGTVTDGGGNYVVNVNGIKATLVYSYIGFIGQEIEVGNKTQINVKLVEDATNLSEVVVVGYGTMKKSDLTGAVAQVKATRMENENPRTIQDMLRGNAPGLDISNNASPRGGGSFLVRGRASLTASTAPLIVVDGVFILGL